MSIRSWIEASGFLNTAVVELAAWGCVYEGRRLRAVEITSELSIEVINQQLARSPIEDASRCYSVSLQKLRS